MTTSMRVRRWAGMAAAVLMISGCTTPQVITEAFDTLTHESVSRSTRLAEYRSFVSINGLAPVHSLGMMFHHPEEVGPSQAIGISPKWSFYTESVLDMPGGVGADQAFDDLGTKYLSLQRLAGDAAVELSALQLADGLLLRAQAQDRKEAEIKSLLTLAGAVLGSTCPAECGLDALQARLVVKQGEYKEALRKFEEAKQSFDTLAGVNNVIVTRWDAQSRQQGGASIGSSASASASESAARRGVAMFGGLKVLTLHFGEDFLDMMKNANTDGFGRLWLFSSTGIVSHIVQARRVRYFSDADLTRAASLRLSLPLTQLKSLGALVEGLQGEQLNLDYTMSLMTSTGNSGKLGGAKVRRHPYCFFPGRAHQLHIEDGIDAADGYQTIYAVRTNVHLPIAKLLGGSNTELQQILEDQGAENKKQGACDKQCRAKAYSELMSAWQLRCQSALHAPQDLWNAFEPPFRQKPQRNEGGTAAAP